MDLKNKTILVTGASSGIGQAIAIAGAKKGAKVFIHYFDNLKGAEETLAEVNKYSAGKIVQADLMFPDNVAKMFQEINEPLDCLVNNAGHAKGGDILDNQIWAYEFANIFFSQVYCTQNFLKQNIDSPLRKAINISSVYGKIDGGQPDYIAYSAAKAAVLSLTVTLAKENSKVLVNAVTPGYVITPAWGKLSEEDKKKYGAEMVCGRMLEPIEIAQAVVDALVDDTKTGQIINEYNGASFELKSYD